MGSFIFDAIHKYGAQRTIQLASVSEPTTVGRPIGIEPVAWATVVRIRIHVDRLSRLDVHVPQVQALVAVCDFLAIGRPGRQIEKRRRTTEADLLHFAQAILRAQVQRVLT